MMTLLNSLAAQFRPGYVVCSFIFLLLGLAALSSSINLLVLRFMILSLEEDEADDMKDADHHVVTLDGELLAVNGRVLAGQQLAATSERNIFVSSGGDELGGSDKTSICSCTCYGRSSAPTSTAAATESVSRRRPAKSRGRCSVWCLDKLFGCRESVTNIDEENFYDEETQSISNFAKYHVKRASF